MIAWQHVRADQSLNDPCILFWTEAGQTKTYAFDEKSVPAAGPMQRKLVRSAISRAFGDHKSRQIEDAVFVNTTAGQEFAFSIQDGRRLRDEEKRKTKKSLTGVRFSFKTGVSLMSRRKGKTGVSRSVSKRKGK